MASRRLGSRSPGAGTRTSAGEACAGTRMGGDSASSATLGSEPTPGSRRFVSLGVFTGPSRASARDRSRSSSGLASSRARFDGVVATSAAGAGAADVPTAEPLKKKLDIER